jgi:hypothetical protein
MADQFGLELVFELNRKDFQRKGDALVAFVHWKLLRSDLKCVGKGEHFGGNDNKTVKKVSPPMIIIKLSQSAVIAFLSFAKYEFQVPIKCNIF